MSPPFQFRCAHCRQDVAFMDAGLAAYEPRNQCPHCLWSRHVMFGCDCLPPCDAMMRPVTVPGARFLSQECEGCGFRWAGYDENWWASLIPEHQTALIDLMRTETERLNGSPVVIFPVRPEYLVRAHAVSGGGARAAARP